MKLDRKTIKIGDVLLVDFPYNDKKGSKRRPAVVTGIKGKKLYVTKITSQIKEHPNNTDLQDLDCTGLCKTSQVQCNRQIVLNLYSNNIIFRIGQLSERDLDNVINKVHSLHKEKHHSQACKSAIKTYCEKVYGNTLEFENIYDKDLER